MLNAALFPLQEAGGGGWGACWCVRRMVGGVEIEGGLVLVLVRVGGGEGVSVAVVAVGLQRGVEGVDGG